MWRKEKGFTFLELAVVVLIMGIMMAVTAPRFASSLSKATIGATARRLAGTIVYLRNAAAREGRSFFLNLDLDKNEHFVTVIKEKGELTELEYQEYQDLDFPEGEIYTEFSDDFVSRTRLQKKIAFAGVVLRDGTPIFDGSVSIELRPNGTADDGSAIYFGETNQMPYEGTVIRLTDSREKVYTVYLQHYNGEATVYKYEYVPEPAPVLVEREPPRRPEDAL
jgi:prepilin-type N-terminal cleavage/methylation domain-containing protein